METNMPDEVNEQTTDEHVQELETKIKELTNNWKRAVADFENYKKRKEQESAELFEFAKEAIATKLIPSLQSLEAIIVFAPKDEKYKDWLKGLDATIKQLEKTMEELGIKKIPTVGQIFDHGMHEAVGEDDSIEMNVIAKEIQPGFSLNGRVIIPARVVVGKK
jgi:molecular chaperone GrpE